MDFKMFNIIACTCKEVNRVEKGKLTKDKILLGYN